ncbi:hypothetical protein ACW9KT_19730 [Hymenobacter sp. HD11105]
MKHPTWGMKPLLALGLLTILMIIVIGTQVVDLDPEGPGLGPLWPVFLATVGCLYLWWLAALLFDLVCIWHASIRRSSCVKQINELVGPPPSPSPDAAKEVSTAPALVGV